MSFLISYFLSPLLFTSLPFIPFSLVAVEKAPVEAAL